MNNAKIEIKKTGDDLTITIKGTYIATGEPSKSGKTMVVASTRGNIQVEGGLTLGLNLYKKR